MQTQQAVCISVSPLSSVRNALTCLIDVTCKALKYRGHFLELSVGQNSDLNRNYSLFTMGTFSYLYCHMCSVCTVTSSARAQSEESLLSAFRNLGSLATH